jgi:hypothetical protein
MEIISGPNVLSRHKSPAFRTTYLDAVADATWQAITSYSSRYHNELRNTVYYLLPQRKNKFKASRVMLNSLIRRVLGRAHQREDSRVPRNTSHRSKGRISFLMNTKIKDFVLDSQLQNDTMYNTFD